MLTDTSWEHLFPEEDQMRRRAIDADQEHWLVVMLDWLLNWQAEQRLARFPRFNASTAGLGRKTWRTCRATVNTHNVAVDRANQPAK